MLKTKDIKEYLKIFKKSICGVVAVKIPYEINSLTPNEIKKHCDKINIPCIAEKSVKQAIDNVIKNYNPEQLIITGSLYLIGKVRNLYI